MINKVIFNIDLKYEPSQWADRKHLEGAAVDRVVAVMGGGARGKPTRRGRGAQIRPGETAAVSGSGLTVLERVVVDGGGVRGERRRALSPRPGESAGNPSRAGVKLQDEQLGLRGGQVRGRRRGIRGLACWVKAPSMEAVSGKEADVTVTAASARRTA